MTCILSSAWQLLFAPLHFHPDDDWSIQWKHQQVIFSELELVPDNLLFIYAEAN